MPDFGDYRPDPKPAAQAENIERVSDKIAAAVIEFCNSVGIGGTFHMLELQGFVSRRFPNAPDSSGRILRDLRKRRLLNYRVVSRKQSEYQVVGPADPETAKAWRCPCKRSNPISVTTCPNCGRRHKRPKPKPQPELF